jgi:hypothetical protein
MTEAGGNDNYHYCGGGCGTVFSLAVGLGPFEATQPASGIVGAAVNILGTNPTGATSVSFNGTTAQVPKSPPPYPRAPPPERSKL